MEKKLLSYICTFLTAAFLANADYAQNGLKRIIVENYYISNSADSAGSIGVLPVGSVTYRIWVQMKPGYKFETVYGNIPHPLKIATTTSFFNNEDRGATNPNGISVVNDKKNSVMIDSWLSVGASASGQMGVLKSDDTNGSVGNSSGILQNADPLSGIPLRTKDGMMPGSPCAVTFVGLTTELDVFNATSNYGNLFTTTNGAWACLPGTMGLNPDSNRVLVAQITTNGILSFQMNIQIGSPAGNAEQYVASNPTGSETYFPGLTYTSPPINSGINEKIKLSDSYTLYPNPAQNEMSLELTASFPGKIYTYSIFDVLGNLICRKKLESISPGYPEHLDISTLSSGMYIFNLQSADGFSSSRKIIKN
ncbi:MAG: T9SS type A sorting domain-containing protein [Bacteroidia bacterium]